MNKKKFILTAKDVINLKIKALQKLRKSNTNSFNDSEWAEMTKFENETFVDESDELKKKSAGAGLTDND